MNYKNDEDINDDLNDDLEDYACDDNNENTLKFVQLCLWKEDRALSWRKRGMARRTFL